MWNNEHTQVHTHTSLCRPTTDQGEVQADTHTSLMIYTMRMRGDDRFCSPKHSYSFLPDQNTATVESLLNIN